MTTRPDCSKKFVNFALPETSGNNCGCVEPGIDCWDPRNRHEMDFVTTYRIRAPMYSRASVVKLFGSREEYVIAWDSGVKDDVVQDRRRLRPRILHLYRARWITYISFVLLVFYTYAAC